MALNENIAYFRKLCGYTQEQLAEKLGVTGQSVSKWEKGVSNPDITLLPELSKALGVDINTLFVDNPNELAEVPFTALPDLCYEEVLQAIVKAQRNFYGIKGGLTNKELKKSVEALKTIFCARFPKCAYMIDEGNPEHGAVFASDAFTFIDRGYAGKEAPLLFDLDKAGEIIQVLGKRNNRKILKIIYQKLIAGGEAAATITPEKLATETGLTVEQVKDGCIELRHISLLEENENIDKGVFKKEYSIHYSRNFIFVLAILRVANLLAADLPYTVLMYRDAKNQKNLGA